MTRAGNTNPRSLTLIAALFSNSFFSVYERGFVFLNEQLLFAVSSLLVERLRITT